MAATKWSNGGGDNKWSTSGNWTVNLPATTDPVTFDSTSTANCTVDGLGTWSGGTLTIAATYTGTITVNSGINVNTAAFSQAAGTWTGNAGDTFTSTTFAVSNGTFTQGGAFVSTTFAVTATGTFTGSSATMSTTAVTFSGSGGGSNLTATSGIWSLAGSWTQSTSSTTFTHNSGTINITAASTFNDARSVFNKGNITTTNAAVTISASTTFPLGATPTTGVGTSTLTVTGTITWSGLWTHTGTISTSNGSILTGTSTPQITLNQSLTITNVTTITNAIGTITFNGTTASTLTDTSDLLSGTTYVVTKSGSTTFAVAASTNCRLGANPTSTLAAGSQTWTSSGTTTWSGTWTLTGGITVGAAGVLTGTSTPTIAMAGAMSVNATGTVTNAIGTITYNGTTASSLTDTGDKLSGTTSILSSSGNKTFTVSASTTMRLGATPTSNLGANTLTVTGALIFIGAWTHTGNLTVTGTLTGTSAPTLTVIEGSPNFTSSTLTNVFDLTISQSSSTTRTFTGGAKTFGVVRRTGSGTGQLTIASSNTFSSFRANDGTVAFTIKFTAGTTQTIGAFLVAGTIGNIVTLSSTSNGSVWTLTTTGTNPINVDYISLQDSVVDATPYWFAGTHSTNVSGNINWIFDTIAPSGLKAFISSGSKISSAVDLGITNAWEAFTGFVIPAAFTGTAVSFQVSIDGTTYQALNDSSNSLVSISVTAATSYDFVGDVRSCLDTWRFVKIVSNLNEAAPRSVTLVAGPSRTVPMPLID